MAEFPTEHAFSFFKWLINPETIATISLYGSGLSLAGRYLWKKLEAKQDADLKNLKNDVKNLSDNFDASMTAMSRDMLRIQIVTGIHSGKLSPGEITMLYDQYKSKGGNSYISRIVEDYLEEKLHERNR